MKLIAWNKQQIEEIEKFKWLESEKAGRDLGDQAILDWIKTKARQYREDNFKKGKKQND